MAERTRILYITGGSVDADPTAAALRAVGLEPSSEPSVPAGLDPSSDIVGVLVSDADRLETLPGFVAALRQAGATLPVVLVASDPGAPAVARALASGASECLAATSPMRAVAEHLAARASTYRAATAPPAPSGNGAETAAPVAVAAPEAVPVPAALPAPAVEAATPASPPAPTPPAPAAPAATPAATRAAPPATGPSSAAQAPTVPAPAPVVLASAAAPEAPAAPAPPAREPAPAADPAEPAQTLWVVCGPRGGVGRTLVAANLAVLAQDGRRVALVDNVPRFGSVLLTFNLPPQTPTWVQLHGEALSEDLFDRLPRHPSGVTVLPAPSSPELADAVAPAAVNNLIHRLVMASDLVVVDQGGRLDNGGIDLMESADRLVVVGTPDNHGVFAVRTWLSICDKLRIPRSRITVLLNSVQPYHQADRERAGRVLEHPVHLLPHAGIDGVRSMSAGEPLAWKQSRSGFVKALRVVANEMLASRGSLAGSGGRSPGG